jgi:hypothetical protein
MGDVITVPLRTKRLVISSPAAVVIGVLNGMISSSAAYIHSQCDESKSERRIKV